MKKIQFGILLMSIFLLSSQVFAFGVGSAYHKDHPLELLPGETKEIIFNLQNMAGNEDIQTKVDITKGSEIVQLIAGDTYSVPIGGSVDVKARVSVPSNAKAGKIYPVEIIFTTLTKSESGTFGLGSSVGREFNIVILTSAEEKAQAEQTKLIFYIISVIIGISLILVIGFVLRKAKRKK